MMLFPSLLVALGLASSVVVQARSNLTAGTETAPRNWTTAGPNTVGYALSTDGPEPIWFDVYLSVYESGGIKTYLMATNQTAVSGQETRVQVFPGTAVNATKELSLDNQYVVKFTGHVRNTTAEDGHDIQSETQIFNLTDPSKPSASATPKAGGSSSVLSFSSVGPLVAVVGFVVAGGVSIF